MENQEKDTMTLAEAQELLQQVLSDIAKNSVHNKKIIRVCR